MSNNSNKEQARRFLELVVSGRVREAYQSYVDDSFRHHNPYFSGDKNSLAEGMKESEASNPGKIFEIKHILEEGDLVAVHSHLRLKAEDAGMATVHIFRFREGRIVELWDVGQAIPSDSPNENGMF